MQYSGFLSLDSQKRVYPLMANDPMTYSSLIVGLWFYGVEDYRSPYVWSMCTRFVLCRNFKEGGSKIPCNGSST